jgi:hypothetical protein
LARRKFLNDRGLKVAVILQLDSKDLLNLTTALIGKMMMTPSSSRLSVESANELGQL